MPTIHATLAPMLRRLVACAVPALLAVGSAATLAGAQAPTATLRAINRDVWLPFMRGVAENVDSVYLGVHSRDYVRVQSRGRLVMDYADYVADTRPIMAELRAKGGTVRLTVRFEERATNGRQAFERGVLEVVSTDGTASAPPRTFYTRFHVVSRLEDGAWKILTEYHTDAGGVGAADFQRAHAVDDVDPFRCARVYGKGEVCG